MIYLTYLRCEDSTLKVWESAVFRNIERAERPEKWVYFCEKSEEESSRWGRWREGGGGLLTLQVPALQKQHSIHCRAEAKTHLSACIRQTKDGACASHHAPEKHNISACCWSDAYACEPCMFVGCHLRSCARVCGWGWDRVRLISKSTLTPSPAEITHRSNMQRHNHVSANQSGCRTSPESIWTRCVCVCTRLLRSTSSQHKQFVGTDMVIGLPK